jgi:AcrR family transcriptional regulator
MGTVRPPTRDAAAPTPRRGRPPRTSPAQIVAVASQLFSRRGYRATTLAAIAASVGVTDAAVLHHFASKAAILDAVHARNDLEAGADLADDLDPGGLETLRRLADWGARMEARPEETSLQIVLSAEALSEESELHPRFTWHYRTQPPRVAHAIQRGIDAGEIRPNTDPMFEAHAIWAVLDGLRLQWFYAPDEFSLDRHFRTYMNQLVERLAAPARRRSSSITGESSP